MAIHIVHRTTAYTPEQLFELVLDVEGYPRFVPWWEHARVRDRRDNSYRTDQIVKFEVIRQQFTSLTTFERPYAIDVTSSGGFFKRFDLHWRFKPWGEGCEIDLTADIGLTARPLQALAERISREAVRVLLGAFEKEAERVYTLVAPGTPAGQFA
jgi:coenzyme Q-binding protein COQ10